MNQIILANCRLVDFPKILPILESFSDIIDYHQKRRVIQAAQKVLEEQPKKPTFYIAVHEGSLIGFAGLQRLHDDPRQMELFVHMVKRGYQGQGIGTKLLNHTVNELVTVGASHIIITIKPTYPPRTKRFYQRRGFKPHFDESYTGASAEDLVMIRPLGIHHPANLQPTLQYLY